MTRHRWRTSTVRLEADRSVEFVHHLAVFTMGRFVLFATMALLILARCSAGGKLLFFRRDDYNWNLPVFASVMWQPD